MGPAPQMPPEHVSPSVHGLLSSHSAVLFACTQPLAGSHESSVHGLLSTQFGADPPLHLPPPHVSFNVQASPSSQGAVLSVKMQPFAESQVSVVQTLPSLQTTVVPTQLPFVQVS